MGYSSYDQYNNRDNYGAGSRLDLDREQADRIRQEQQERWRQQELAEQKRREEMENRLRYCTGCGGSRGRFIQEVSRQSNVVGSKWDPCTTCGGTGQGR